MDLAVRDPLVLSREELVVSLFDIVEEDLGGFGPWFFLSSWEVFHVKRIGVPVCWFESMCWEHIGLILPTCRFQLACVRAHRTCPLLRQRLFPPYMFDAYVSFNDPGSWCINGLLKFTTYFRCVYFRPHHLRGCANFPTEWYQSLRLLRGCCSQWLWNKALPQVAW